MDTTGTSGYMELILQNSGSLLNILIVVFLTLLILIVIVTLKTGRSFKLKLFGQEVDFSGMINKSKNANGSKKVKMVNGKPCPPHAQCMHSRDFLLVINKTTDIVYKKAMIETRTMLESQMVYAEEKSTFIISMLQEKYQRMLREKEPEMKPETHIQYRYYSSLVAELMRYMLMLTKHGFLENGLISYDDKNIFNQYANEKAEFMINKATNWMSEHYPTIGMLISFDELVKSDENYLPKFKNLAVDVFNHALSIVKEKKVEITKMEKELDDYIKQVVGIENS